MQTLLCGNKSVLLGTRPLAAARAKHARCAVRPIVAMAAGRGGASGGDSAAAPTPRDMRTAAVAAPAPPAASGATPHWQQALNELDKKEGRKIMVVQTAPAVRVAIAEAFGLPPGAVTQGQLVSALRALGFEKIFDTLMGADLTIVEEGCELLHRLEAKAAERAGKAPAAPAADGEGHAASSVLPMFTSCCPGWVAMVEKSNPELIPYLSTCKSPQMMLAAVIKTHFASSLGVGAGDICAVSIMPCVRKQGEADRPWFETEAGENAGMMTRDVDHVITTAELGNILKARGIDIASLPESEYDSPLGAGSGGGVLFGTTGGVMEAALRTVYELVSGQPMGRIVFEEVRGLDGLKEAAITIPVSDASPFKALESAPGAGVTLRIAVANGLGVAKKIIKALAQGEAAYDFVEVMACPGGCIGGGGQPRSTDKGILAKRQAAMYTLDERSAVRRPHDNEAIQTLYKNFLGKPNSHLAERLLHTHYVPGGVEADGGKE